MSGYHINTCIGCGAKFYAEKPQFRTCPRCWCEANPDKTGRIAAGLLGMLALAEDQVQMIAGQLADLQEDRAGAGIDGDLLKRLLQLSHPDRHGNSQLATKTFQDLQRIKP